ncbi:NADH-dependent flavin oxidoreductase nadA [Fusarium oxysporum f. sp. albedinis]|nr:NADH-dependent flavin oxidoreductase nadA [Fusarium oxysporum f. sp. albedinis]
MNQRMREASTKANGSSTKSSFGIAPHFVYKYCHSDHFSSRVERGHQTTRLIAQYDIYSEMKFNHTKCHLRCSSRALGALS